jgi:Ras-related protein Rab-6A
MNNSSKCYCFKIILAGDTATGKSSLLHKFVSNKFNLEHTTTIGVDYFAKYIYITPEKEKVKIKIQCWDLTGQENFKVITEQYFRNISGAIVVFDITNYTTFENIQDWIESIMLRNENIDLPIIIVGNKIDLNNMRTVSYELGLNYSNKSNYIYIETSCLTGENIENVFSKIGKKIYEKLKNNNFVLSNGIQEVKLNNNDIGENY